MNRHQRHQRPHLLGGEAKQARVLREHHHKQFVEQVSSGLVWPRDRINKPLGVDDLVEWHVTLPPICQIMEINVVPLGLQPPEGGVLEIILAVSTPIAIQVGQTIDILTRVKDASADTEGRETPPAEAPPAPETPDDSPDLAV